MLSFKDKDEEGENVCYESPKILIKQLVGEYEACPVLINVCISLALSSVGDMPSLDYSQAAKAILPVIAREGLDQAVVMLKGMAPWLDSVDIDLHFIKGHRQCQSTKLVKGEWHLSLSTLAHLGLGEVERQEAQLVQVDLVLGHGLAWSVVKEMDVAAWCHVDRPFKTLESLCQHLLSGMPSGTRLTLTKPKALTGTLGGASIAMTRTPSLPDSLIIIALGSNVGDRWANLNKAIAELRRNLSIIDTSMVYESAPVSDCNNHSGGPYLNAVVRVETTLPPGDLLRLLQSIERDMGRPEVREKDAPRRIDLDLIAYSGYCSPNDPFCILPHPRAHERPFVLQPMFDMLPQSWLLTLLPKLAINPSSLKLPRFLQIGNLGWQPGSRTLVMGIINVTPDSFSDGGQYLAVEQAVEQAHRLVAAGMDILDLGGQSTRPGAEIVSLEVELSRVIPVIQAIKAAGITIPLSIDTFRAEVARQAIKAGASMVNDVTGGHGDALMLSTVAELGVPVCLMHSRGNPQTMNNLANYHDLLGEITAELQLSIKFALQAGIPRWNLILDPGIGFAKQAAHNLELLRCSLPLDYPLLYGPSRKGFIGKITGQSEPSQRIMGTAACVTAAIAAGASIVRVHDPGMVEVVRMADAIYLRV